jgi:hypothetical protein
MSSARLHIKENKMETYEKLINKYNCALDGDKIYTKDGVDTKINYSSIVAITKDLEAVKASNEMEAKQDLLIMFENLLKERTGVELNG